MQEKYNTNNSSQDFDDNINLRELFYILLEGKGIIISLTFFVSIIGVLYSLFLPNIYQSNTILVPANSSSNISGAPAGYTSLAGLAGINLNPDGGKVNYEKAIQKISSLSFFENNIISNIHLPNLMALKAWDAETNTLIYNDNIYNTNSGNWIGDKTNSNQQPSTQKSFRVFNSRHLTLEVDSTSGFIILSIKHQSPYIAKEWAELVVNEINTFYRQKDKSESERAVSYLNNQISMTTLAEIKQVLAQLLQEETKKLTLIEANESYVFEYIDPPAVMEMKSGPKRSLISIITAIFGGMLSILVVLIRHYAFIKKT